MTIYTSTHTQTEIDNGVDNAICYGTSSTGASIAQKDVTVSTGAFSLSAGRKIVVKFSNANTANTPTLKVGTNSAKNIYSKGSQITTGGNKALIAGVCEFIYDGTQFHLIGSYIDTTYSSKSASSGGTTVSLCTTGEKYTWNNKGTYSKPSDGIPKTDLAPDVQTSLGLANTAAQSTDGIYISRYASEAKSSAKCRITVSSSNSPTVLEIIVTDNWPFGVRKYVFSTRQTNSVCTLVYGTESSTQSHSLNGLVLDITMGSYSMVNIWKIRGSATYTVTDAS